MRIVSVGLVLALTVGVASATETRHWVTDSAEELLAGRGDGVAVTGDGRLEVVPGWQDGPVFDEPVVVAGERMADGSLIVGTGHPARLYKVRGDRKELLTSVPGEQVTAVHVTPDGDVLVASVMPGILSRWRDNRLEEMARLGDSGIWDLESFAGTVVAATGTPASLYRIGDRGLVRWLELPDGHARCLDVVGDTLLVGTSGKGLILGVDRSGRVALLADSPFTEIPDLVAAPDGSVWAVALVGEPVKPAPKKNDGKGENGESNGRETATVNLDLPKINGATATSELLRLTPEGALLHVHRFAKQVAAALVLDGDGVLVGTGYEGEVWRFVVSGGARLTAVDAAQVVAIVDGGSALLTQGPGRVLWRRVGAREARFRIDAKRYPRPVRFGEYRVTPAGGPARIRFRSGAAEKPDDTWLPWTEWLAAGSGTVPLPAGRSLQWELELTEGSVVERVTVASREVNLAPRIMAVSVEDPGVIYLSTPPSVGPVIDRDHPDLNGIFTVIDEKPKAKRNSSKAKGKKYYRTGFRTVSWSAQDGNEDPLRFALEVERNDGWQLPVRDEIDGVQMAIDTTALPDGSYRIRVTADDQLENPGDALRATGISRWFVVDNTPPAVELSRRDDKWVVVVSDAMSTVARVEWSRDGDRWSALAPEDGVLDGSQETFSFGAKDGRHFVVVRAVDRHHNRATIGAVEE